MWGERERENMKSMGLAKAIFIIDGHHFFYYLGGLYLGMAKVNTSYEPNLELVPLTQP